MKCWKKLIFILVTIVILVGCRKDPGLDEKSSINRTKKIIENDLLLARDLDNEWYQDLPYIGQESSYAYDVDDQKEAVGISQYVFIGFVEEYIETMYNGEFPNTNYKIKVLENLKGDLEKNKSYIMRKTGGISKNNDRIYLEEGDLLPLSGEIYLFMGETLNGKVCIGGKNSNIPLDIEANGKTYASILSRVHENDSYSSYLEATKEEIIPEWFDVNDYESTPTPLE